MDERDPLIKVGRPRLNVDFTLVLRLRDDEHLGWTLGAQQYRERTKQWISRDTFKRRYYEAKAASEPGATNVAKPKVVVESRKGSFLEEWERKLKEL